MRSKPVSSAIQQVLCIVLLLSLPSACTPTAHSNPTLADSLSTAHFALPTPLAGVENFAQVSPVLYRGAQPTAEGFALLKKLGIKTIINLRTFHSDREAMAGNQLQYFHLFAKAWHPEDEDVAAFLRIVNDPANQPVFVHCAQGSDRTGYTVAVYRMVNQGWSCEDAIAEMHNFDFHEIWMTVPAYLRSVDVDQMRRASRSAEIPEMRIIQ